MRIVALYLPQFHEIKENNEWWGKGYTEWTAVKNAKPLFNGHYQPVEPLNDNYYDLSDESGYVLSKQADMARNYGIYGFCFYHYWFKTGSQLLEKPMEILLDHPEIDINYCICWANETWKRTWYSEKKQILCKQEYGDKDEWINHYQYLRKFFRDKRYIKEDNRPIVLIYHSKDIEKLADMVHIWNNLAREDGFAGVYIVAGNTGNIEQDKRKDGIDAYYNYEPGFSKKKFTSFDRRVVYGLKRKITDFYNKFAEHKIFTAKFNSDVVYENIDKVTEFNGKKCYLGTFTGYDDTPRRQYKGDIYSSSILNFKKSLVRIKKKLDKIGRKDDFVFITAWNEWGEGAHLEPDKKDAYSYLETVRDVQCEEA